MKIFFLLIGITCLPLFMKAQNDVNISNKIDTAKTILIVEAACGQCKFGMIKKGCNLAVRINGNAYFVSGASIDSYGDAHAKDGFCEAIRMAKVQGELIDTFFKVSYFELIKQ